MKRSFTAFLVLSLMIGLAACGQKPVLTAAFAPVSKADIAVAEVALTEAIRVANTCLKIEIGPCNVPATRKVIIADVHVAYDAFKRLQAATDAGSSAAMVVVNEAIRALTAATPATK